MVNTKIEMKAPMFFRVMLIGLLLLLVTVIIFSFLYPQGFPGGGQLEFYLIIIFLFIFCREKKLLPNLGYLY
jgi:hypothetical protein